MNDYKLLLHYQAGKNHATQKAVGLADFNCFNQEANRLRELAKIPPTSLTLKTKRITEQEP